MVRVRLPGVHRLKRRLADGRTVEYHTIRGLRGSTFWKSDSGVKVGSAEYLCAYKAAAKPAAKRSGTFDRIIDDYLDSGEFRKLRSRTKADYRRWCDKIRDKFGNAPVEAMERPQIRAVAMKWRDQWDGRNAAYAWTVLRRVVSWAYDRGHLSQHHLRGGGGVYTSNRSEVIWTEPELLTMEQTAAPEVADALRAVAETGLRPGDAVRLSKAHVVATPAGRRIQIRTNKRGRVASIPVTPKMGEIIDRAAGLLILRNTRGAPWSEGALSHAVMRAKRRAGLRDELRLYDARGSACTRLVLAGATISEIAAHMGWSVKTTAQMVEVYAALDPALTDGVLVKLEQMRGAGV